MSRRSARHLTDARDMALGLGDGRLAAQIEATLGQALAAAGDYTAALPLMDGALGAKQRDAQIARQRDARRGNSVAVGSAFTLASKGGLLGDRGDFTEAQAQFDEALALAGNSVHPIANSIRNWAMVVLVWQGRWDEAADMSADSARRAHATQALLPLAISRACEGYGRWATSGDAQGLRQLAAAVEWLQQRRGRFMSSIYRGWLVEALATTGDMAGARRQAAALFARARQRDTFGVGDGCRALALADAAAGNSRRSARMLGHAERWAALRGSRREVALNTLCRARLAALRADLAAAQALSEEAAEAFDEMQMAWHADRARALASLKPEETAPR